MQSRKFRGRTEILYDILQTARNDGNGVGKTKIMCGASISYYQLKEYLTAMTHKELLQYDLGIHKFRITERGLQFLDRYNQLVNEIEEKNHHNNKRAHERNSL